MIYHCPLCESPRNFKAIAQHVAGSRDEPPAEYSFAACEECALPAVFLREDYGRGFDDDTYYRVFPPHLRHLRFPLPPIVKESYDAAVRCENAKILLPAVVMVGRALEAVCHEHDPSAKGLYQGLQSMYKAGLISQEIMDWANELRVLRNVGAHATTADRIAPQDVTESLDFLQAILEILYDLRPKFNKMKARRAKAAPPASGATPSVAATS